MDSQSHAFDRDLKLPYLPDNRAGGKKQIEDDRDHHQDKDRLQSFKDILQRDF